MYTNGKELLFLTKKDFYIKGFFDLAVFRRGDLRKYRIFVFGFGEKEFFPF